MDILLLYHRLSDVASRGLTGWNDRDVKDHLIIELATEVNFKFNNELTVCFGRKDRAMTKQ